MPVKPSSAKTRVATTLVLVAVGALLVPAVGASRPAGAAGDPSTDKLAQVLARGTLILSTDPAYPPQGWRRSRPSSARATTWC